MQQILAGENLSTVTTHGASEQLPSRHFGHFPKTGRILLVGSGPGHPSLLTVATHAALTQQADLVLSDKLVPDAVLALIPKHVHVRIARKFPGNADGAQIEMMEAAVEAAQRGLTVVRVSSLPTSYLTFIYFPS
jgi:uroporphyrin-III C-methyltransferase